jgi:NAD(P)-dependent dehydrogenase (short-subunit alcohol dehydrogenase family)
MVGHDARPPTPDGKLRRTSAMAKRLEGKTAVLTGSARLSGLGHAFSKGLAAAGARIVIADILDGGEAVEKIKETTGSDAIAVKCDVSKEADVAKLKATAEEKFGAVDIVVHAASPFPGHMLEEIEPAEWRHVLSVNLDGIYLLSHAFVPGMKARGWGRIIPISSTTYQAGTPGRTHYVTAKAGVIGFARSLAREVGDFGITVNVLSPGLVDTEGSRESIGGDALYSAENNPYEIIRQQQCIRRTLVPDNLVGPLVFLASDDAAYVTGQALFVDAGWQHTG